MEKFKKFCKKPLLIISICIMAIFSLGLIVMGSISHASANYKYHESFFGISIHMELDFDEDEVVVTESAFGETIVTECDFIIKNGKLLIKGEGETTYEEIGKIDAYNFTMKLPLDETDPTSGYITIKCKCNLTYTIRIINIIMIVIGGLGIASSVIYTLYEKNKAKTATTSEVSTENAEN